MNARKAWIVAAAALALPLAGCLGRSVPEPNDQDVAQAVSALVLATSAVRAPDGATTHPLTVTRVRNLGCNPAPDYKGTLCETVISTQRAPQGVHQQTRLVRMVKTADGWHATMQ